MLEKHCFSNGNRVYHISIIDYLQTWNLHKKLERLTKTVFLGKDGQNLSAVDPNVYASRFTDFVLQNVIY